MSLRRLINIRILLSVIIIMLLGGVTAVWQARQSVEKEVQSSINFALQMIEFGFSQMPVASRYDINWLSQLSALQQTRHLKIAIEEQGKESLNLLTQRVVGGDELKPPQWFIHIMMTEYLTVHYDIKMADGGVKRLVITADPLDEISEVWRESQAFFLSISIMLLVIYFAINLVFHSIFKAVQSILAGLRKVELGEYGNVLPPSNISEFNAIASEVNTMSAALKQAEDKNQALAKHTIQIQETERQTMSRELHDEMGQSLTAIKAMAMTSKQPNIDITTTSDLIIEICNHLALVVRSMMRTLHPLSLTELGLGPTLSILINEWGRRYPDLNVLFDYDDELEQLDDKVAIHVYRIVQECLTNVVRHANATEVKVRLLLIGKPDMPMVDISVKDNGIGGKMGSKGFGVLGMRERVEILNGTFMFNSNTEQGVEVHAWMPFTEKESG